MSGRRMTSLVGLPTTFFFPSKNLNYYILLKFPSRKIENIPGAV